jgi:hypothetical protein
LPPAEAETKENALREVIRPGAWEQPAVRSDERRISSLRLQLLLGGVVALAVFTVGLVLYRGKIADGMGEPAIKSLAVLPLKNLSGDPNQEYLACATKRPQRYGTLRPPKVSFKSCHSTRTRYSTARGVSTKCRPEPGLAPPGIPVRLGPSRVTPLSVRRRWRHPQIKRPPACRECQRRQNRPRKLGANSC